MSRNREGLDRLSYRHPVDAGGPLTWAYSDFASSASTDAFGDRSQSSGRRKGVRFRPLPVLTRQGWPPQPEISVTVDGICLQPRRNADVKKELSA
jgi:hypothetical protein